MIGSSISHYKILEKIGEGGMGIVYKAQDTKLDRIVALKFLPHHLTANDAEKARFLQEAKAASSLNHPNVCTIYGLDEHDGQQFIEMEYVDGVTLRQKIPFDKLNDVLTYAIQIADALQEAHSKGIVHRDIKADNIMVNSKNQIKVMDFGLAKLKGSLKLTRTSSTVGTLAYMPPEQIQGQDVDHRSDIFSFGVVLFEMLTGKLPFRGDHEAAIMYSIMNEEPESAQKHRPDLSAEVLHILSKALEKDPADRYQSAQDMLIDLRRLQKQSTKLSRASLAAMPRPSQETLAHASSSTSITPKKSSQPLFIIGGIVLLVVLGVFYRFFFSDSEATKSAPFQSISMSRLTSSGKASLAAISPDGKYVAHVVVEGERISLWMRQVATSSNVMIVPPSTASCRGITFGNDGNFVYYVIIDDKNPNGSLFEIPALGGTPRKILSDLRTAVTFSPDGKQVAFIRQYSAVGEEVLMVANSDGSGERKLSVRRGDDFFITDGVAPSWSPDGKIIAMPAATNKGVQHVNLMGYDPSTGAEKLLSPEDWAIIGRVMWTDGGKGIAFVAVKRTVLYRPQLWYVRYPEGDARSVTNDLSNYDMASLGVSSDASSMVSTTVDLRSNLWVLTRPAAGNGMWENQAATRITSSASTRDGDGGLSWTGDGKIVYVSNPAGVRALCLIGKDGSNQRQLSVGLYREYYPRVSPDSKYIYYTSDKDTTAHIWRMDIDGGNPTKLSSYEDYHPNGTPDGKWVVYGGWATGKTIIYKKSLAGGEPIPVSSNPASNPKLSPDGRLIICNYYKEEDRRWGIGIISFADGTLQRYFAPSNTSNEDSFIWSPDGRSLTYVDTENGVSNIWSMPVAGGSPKKLTNFTSDLIFSYDWSPDGKYLAVARGEETRNVVLVTSTK